MPAGCCLLPCCVTLHRCSETGAAFFNDMFSKHAMHSNVAEEVLYAGGSRWAGACLLDGFYYKLSYFWQSPAPHVLLALALHGVQKLISYTT